MTFRRLLPLLMLVALVVAPFGRVAAAETMAASHRSVTMAGHCADMPAPDQAGHEGKSTIDCLVACAAMVADKAVILAETLVPPQLRHASVPPEYSGLHPEAEPPPPRRS